KTPDEDVSVSDIVGIATNEIIEEIVVKEITPEKEYPITEFLDKSPEIEVATSDIIDEVFIKSHLHDTKTSVVDEDIPRKLVASSETYFEGDETDKSSHLQLSGDVDTSLVETDMDTILSEIESQIIVEDKISLRLSSRTVTDVPDVSEEDICFTRGVKTVIDKHKKAIEQVGEVVNTIVQGEIEEQPCVKVIVERKEREELLDGDEEHEEILLEKPEVESENLISRTIAAHTRIVSSIALPVALLSSEEISKISSVVDKSDLESRKLEKDELLSSDGSSIASDTTSDKATELDLTDVTDITDSKEVRVKPVECPIAELSVTSKQELKLTKLSEDDVQKLMTEVLEATMQIRADVKEMKPDLTPTPEGQLLTMLPCLSTDQSLNDLQKITEEKAEDLQKLEPSTLKSFTEADQKLPEMDMTVTTVVEESATTPETQLPKQDRDLSDIQKDIVTTPEADLQQPETDKQIAKVKEDIVEQVSKTELKEEPTTEALSLSEEIAVAEIKEHPKYPTEQLITKEKTSVFETLVPETESIIEDKKPERDSRKTETSTTEIIKATDTKEHQHILKEEHSLTEIEQQFIMEQTLVSRMDVQVVKEVRAEDERTITEQLEISDESPDDKSVRSDIEQIMTRKSLEAATTERKEKTSEREISIADIDKQITVVEKPDTETAVTEISEDELKSRIIKGHAITEIDEQIHRKRTLFEDVTIVRREHYIVDSTQEITERRKVVRITDRTDQTRIEDTTGKVLVIDEQPEIKERTPTSTEEPLVIEDVTGTEVVISEIAEKKHKEERKMVEAKKVIDTTLKSKEDIESEHKEQETGSSDEESKLDEPIIYKQASHKMTRGKKVTVGDLEIYKHKTTAEQIDARVLLPYESITLRREKSVISESESKTPESVSKHEFIRYSRSESLEPSETESSQCFDIQTTSDRSVVSARHSVRSASYEVQSPHSDVTEFSMSLRESAAETSFCHDEEISYVDGSGDSMIPPKRYEVTSKDIVMRDDVLEITVNQGDEDMQETDVSVSRKYASQKIADTAGFISETESSPEKRKHRVVIREDRDVSSSTKTGAISKKKMKKTIAYSAPQSLSSPRLLTVKTDSDADVSSDDERVKDGASKKMLKGKVFKKTATTSSKISSSTSSEYSTVRHESRTSKLPRYEKQKISATKRIDDRWTGQSRKITKPETSTEEQFTPPHRIIKTDKRVYGYMQSTLSRDLKIEKHDTQKSTKDSINRRKVEQKEKQHKLVKHSEKSDKTKGETTEVKEKYTRRKVPEISRRTRSTSTESKVHSRETTPSRSRTPREPSKSPKIEKSSRTRIQHTQKESKEREMRREKKYIMTTTSVIGKGALQSTVTSDHTGMKVQTSKTESTTRRSTTRQTHIERSKTTVTRAQATNITKVAASKTVIKLHKGEPTITHSEVTGMSAKKVELIPKSDLELLAIQPSKEPAKPVVKMVEEPKPVLEVVSKDKEIPVSTRVKVKPSTKPSAESEKTVQFADRVRSQSVVPMSNRDRSAEHQTIERSITPSSLPSSPSRIRSTQGGTQVLTSEVFTRTVDSSGSIEVIYRQPSETLRKISHGKPEMEMSLIDTTDSSLSESVALPSSSSDHDVSSEANGRLKSIGSPASPKPIPENETEISYGTRSEVQVKKSIGETLHELSALAFGGEDTRKASTSQYTGTIPRTDKRTTTSTAEATVVPAITTTDDREVISKREFVAELNRDLSELSRKTDTSEESLSSVLDTRVQVKRKSTTEVTADDKAKPTDDSEGNTYSVSPDASVMSIRSMASQLETLLDELTSLPLKHKCQIQNQPIIAYLPLQSQQYIMSYNNINIPVISIIPDDDVDIDMDNENDNMNIDDVATDTEDIYFSTEKRKKKTKKHHVPKKDPYATDVEDLEGSDNDDIVPLAKHANPISLDDVLEQTDVPAIEETYKLDEKNKRGKPKLRSQASTTTNPQHLEILEDEFNQGLTDVEDFDNSSADNEESEPDISDTDLLNEILHDAGTVAISDNYDSNDDLKIITKSKCNKTKKNSLRKNSAFAITDTEDMELSDSDQMKLRRMTVIGVTKSNTEVLPPSTSKGSLPFMLNELMNDEDIYSKLLEQKRPKFVKHQLKVTENLDIGLTDTEEIEGDDITEEELSTFLDDSTTNFTGEFESYNGVVEEKVSSRKVQNLYRLEGTLFTRKNSKVSDDPEDTDEEEYESDMMGGEKCKEMEESTIDFNFTLKKKPQMQRKIQVVKTKAQGNTLTASNAMEDSVLTDVENLESSDDDDNEDMDKKEIPMTIVNTDDNPTDSDSIGDGEANIDLDRIDEELDDSFIPICPRNLVKEKEKEDGTCDITVTLLQDEPDKLNIPNTSNDALTDLEDFSGDDEVSRENSCDDNDMPEIECEEANVNQCDSIKVPEIESEVDTDVEEIDIPRKTTKHIASKHFLLVATKDEDVITDLEDFDLSDNENNGNSRLTLAPNTRTNLYEAKTDVEDFEDSDNDQCRQVREIAVTPDILRQMGGDTICLKEGDGKFSVQERQKLNERSNSISFIDEPPSPTHTDEFITSADDDNYSRAETATPVHVRQELDEASSVRVLSSNVKKINLDADDEVMYLKGGGFMPDVYTDTEEMGVSDEEYFSASDKAGDKISVHIDSHQKGQDKISLEKQNGGMSVAWHRGSPSRDETSKEWGPSEDIGEKPGLDSERDAAQQETSGQGEGATSSTVRIEDSSFADRLPPTTDESGQGETPERVATDLHQLSSEMKDLLAEMEKHSKQ
ncbi:hypothetical protein CBL_11750, partial [Carabus blaptoides fortunei]